MYLMEGIKSVSRNKKISWLNGIRLVSRMKTKAWNGI